MVEDTNADEGLIKIQALHPPVPPGDLVPGALLIPIEGVHMGLRGKKIRTKGQ